MDHHDFTLPKRRIAQAGTHAYGPPERLVALGFRHWFTGYRTGDVHSWERAFQIYDQALGCRNARLAVGGLSSWVKSVNAAARRKIDVSAPACSSFCRDECLAVTMIAACQHDACPALRACAFALVDSALIGEVESEAEGFAAVLRSMNQMLSPATLMAGVQLPLSGAQVH